ncbi:MAG: flagellar basal body-associated FliL family protein [Pseudomonadota bacterium]
MESAVSEANKTPNADKPKRRWPLFLALAVALAGAGGGGAWWWFGRAQAEAPKRAAPKPAIYHALEPTFVVNLADPDAPRYLQVEVQLMTRDPEVQPVIELHAPRIRNRLLLLFSQQYSTNLRTRADKERLQREALAEVQAILKAETGKPGVEALYFTSFVTQ